jgi:hypothetical protein
VNKTRRLLLLSSSCVAVLIPLSSANGQNSTVPTNSTYLTYSPTNSTYLTYSDKDVGFSIQYPSDWTIENRNAQFSSVVGFIPPEGIGEVDVRVFPKGDY